MERYWRAKRGRLEVLIRRRPSWQRGAATAKAVADGLNHIPELEDAVGQGFGGLASHVAAWRDVRDIFEASLEDGRLRQPPTETSNARFKDFAGQAPVPLTLDDRGGPIVGGDDPHPGLVHLLWSTFFRDPVSSRLPGAAWARLKRCPICQRWFADETKNRAQRWCSEPCHTQAWSRSARRAAGHKQYAKKGARR
ncbi:MAG: CGNR zinc finger domain-containing protein [Candidatus Rokuibacteriota bacterium]